MANILILICMHLLGDFYFQTSKMAKCKNALIIDACGKCKKCKKGYWINAKFLCIHSLIYMIPFLLLFSLTDWINAIMMIAVLGFVHGLIDFFTCFIKHKLKQTIGFLADQTLHIVSIAAVVKILTFKSGLDEYYVCVKTICALLALIMPCSIIVSKLLKDIYPEVEERGIFDVGSMIGVMERIMTVIFAYLGNFAAIAIIISVKTWARNDDLKGEQNKDFRNKYLLGTLSSLVLALILFVLYDKVL